MYKQLQVLYPTFKKIIIRFNVKWFFYGNLFIAPKTKVLISGKIILFHRLLSWKIIINGFASQVSSSIWNLITLILILLRLSCRSFCFIILYSIIAYQSHLISFNLFEKFEMRLLSLLHWNKVENRIVKFCRCLPLNLTFGVMTLSHRDKLNEMKCDEMCVMER